MPLIRSSSLPLESAGLGKVSPPTAAHPGDATENRIRVVIAMSGALERMAWSLIVGGQRDMELVAEVASCDEVLALLEAHAADVTLIDEAVLGSARTIEFRRYCRQPLSSRFVLVTLHSLFGSPELTRPGFIHSCLLKGASAAELLQAIRSAAATVRI